VKDKKQMSNTMWIHCHTHASFPTCRTNSRPIGIPDLTRQSSQWRYL